MEEEEGLEVEAEDEGVGEGSEEGITGDATREASGVGEGEGISTIKDKHD